jgi:MFS family permease
VLPNVCEVVLEETELEATISAGSGRIAARVDRLPLTWLQWRLALISQIFWGVIIAADGVPAKLYPFTWGPRHAFGEGALSVLLAMQFGVGILIGEYLIGIAADLWGRRRALLLSTLCMALLFWPTALTDRFPLLLLFYGLSSIGMGGVLSTNVVYMGEIVPPRDRGRVMLASQILAIAVYGVLGNVPGLLWIPSHTDWYIYCFSIVALVVLVPLALWGMPESPRWLEAHGRHSEAEAVISSFEAETRRRTGLAVLPEPDYAAYVVPVATHVPVGELFRGQYRGRSIMLLVAWILGYSGIVYGFLGFLPLLLRTMGFNVDQTFAVLLISSAGGGALGLALCALLNERVERRKTIFVAALVHLASMALLYAIAHGPIETTILITIACGAETVWLFSMYNFTAASYPTRLRATGTGLTDGVGHLGAIFGPIVAGALFTATSGIGHLGWFAYITLPGAVIPAALVAWFGSDQRKAILEQISR